jgi:hypothetical protein
MGLTASFHVNRFGLAAQFGSGPERKLNGKPYPRRKARALGVGGLRVGRLGGAGLVEAYERVNIDPASGAKLAALIMLGLVPTAPWRRSYLAGTTVSSLTFPAFDTTAVKVNPSPLSLLMTTLERPLISTSSAETHRALVNVGGTTVPTLFNEALKAFASLGLNTESRSS